MGKNPITISKLVALFGAVYIIYQSVTRILAFELNLLFSAIIGIILAVVIIATTGIIKNKLSTLWRWEFILLLGIGIAIFFCIISGIIIIIAAILLYYKQ
jgi:chromate transport protein ChrA